MSWKTQIFKLVNQTKNILIDILASSLTAAGNLACIASGATITFSQLTHTSIDARYFTAGNFKGATNIQTLLSSYDLQFNFEIPVEVEENKFGSFPYSLSDYIESKTLLIGSAALLGMGIACKMSGTTLKKFSQNQQDIALSSKYDTRLANASSKEWLYLYLHTLFDSLTLSLMTTSTLSGIFFFSSLLSKINIHYPFTGHLGNHTDYPACLGNITFPVQIVTKPENLNISFPYLGKVNVVVDALINGSINASYGAGLFLNKIATNNSVITPVLNVTATSVWGVGAYLSSSFFSKKTQQLRDQRIIEAHQDLIPNLP